jgi:D-alanyl-D-alanine carboxypeptidase
MPRRDRLSVGLQICVALLILIGLSSYILPQTHPEKLQRRSASASSSRGKVGPRASPPLKTAPEATSRNSASFESAATANVRLQANLAWTFGSRPQRGWQIYEPLIAHLIGSSGEPWSRVFATRLAHWQTENGLVADGVLDDKTLLKIISTLQSKRIRDRAYPSDDQLVTISVSDCYYPERPEELRRVERETYKAYKRMVAAAIADRSLGLNASGGHIAANEKFLKIVSAFRSREYQDQLRKQSPQSGRAGLAVNSPHFTGRALDLYVGGEPVSTKDKNRALQTQTLVYRWLVQNAARFGFQPYFYEPWHWEYVEKKQE